MKVYDCFLFHNELDLLELRLKTLNHVVDQFVLVESVQTFSGNPKPLHFCDNRDRFTAWEDKIKVVVVPAQDSDPWSREYAARASMAEGFKDADPMDLVFQSDCDEIWRPEDRDQLLGVFDTLVYEMLLCYYYMNTPRVPRLEWYGTRRCRVKDWPGGQALRKMMAPRIHDAGWHFSYLGDVEFARTKMKAFSHTEYSDDSFTDVPRLERCIAGGFDPIHPTARYLPVEVDKTFPKPMLEEPERWSKFIRRVSG